MCTIVDLFEFAFLIHLVDWVLIVSLSRLIDGNTCFFKLHLLRLHSSRLQHRLDTKWQQNMTTNIAADVKSFLLCFLLHDECNRRFCCFRFICCDCFCFVYRLFDQLFNVTLTFLRAKPTKQRQQNSRRFSRLCLLLAVGCWFLLMR